VLLFRYSALTFNRPPYPLRPRLRHQGRGLSRPGLPRPAAGAGLIVEFAAKLQAARQPKEIQLSRRAAVFEGSEFSINANETAAGMELWTANSQGQPTMKGTATW
jgi:3-methylfumaryl-CoA hydratase